MTETVLSQFLADSHRRIHRALIEAVLVTGLVPTVEELAAQLETGEEAIRESLTALSVADYLALDPRGEVSCLYPFSATPTPHVVVIDGQPRFAMCAIDALGLPAMLNRELDITARCAVCNTPIAMRVRPGTIVTATPAAAMVVARSDEAEPAFAACCPFTVFVCGQPHAEQFMRRVAGTHALSLAEALAHGERIFAGLLDDELPAARPRSKGFAGSRDA